VPSFTACTDDNDQATMWATHAHDEKTQAVIIIMNTALAGIFLKTMFTQMQASFQQ
jgi:hypothetical protein